MTAYGALISLENTIHNVLKSYHHSPFNEILVAAYKELQPLQEILERLDNSSKSKSRKKVNALDGRIKEKLWNFEDLLETLLSHRRSFDKVERLEEEEDGLYTHLREAADSLIQALKDMKEEYIHEVNNMPDDDNEEEEKEAAINSSSSSSAGTKSKKMIGLCDEFRNVKNIITMYEDHIIILIYGLVGMAGLGKTTFAREVFEDPEILSYYDRRVWITVGRKYELKQVSRGVLDQVQGGKKCLIVLDDVWETRVLSMYLTSLEELKDGRFIQILLTTRARSVIGADTHHSVLRFLNEEESKELLFEKVFGEKESCPPLLEKAAAKIAKNCEGLPLMILTVAKHLSNSRDPDYWNEVAEEKNTVFTDSYEEISKVLFPSYDYLPQRFKMPFMYMGVFPRDYDVPLSKILNMLSAEGWMLDPNKNQSLQESAIKCLKELCLSYNLILFKQKSSSLFAAESSNMIKTYRLHSSWRHLCRREARNNKFFLVLNRLVDASLHSQEKEEEAVLKGQRGLCIENTILFGLKEFCNSVKFYCASSTRSLLFFGPYHQYPTPIDSIGFKLLRELDALQLRFYNFPAQILTLVQLKYLALTCNGQLPTTISKLSKLRTLIIHPHLSIIKCHTSPSIIPTQIWDMPELEHIEIFGKSLRASTNVGACLRKLSNLVGVNADMGTISELSQRIPNIRKLGVQVELTPYDNTSSNPDPILSCFECISTLDNLQILKCSIMNPVLVIPAVALAPTSMVLPRELKKLHLSGMGFPWEYMMSAIASLPYLQVLKLQSYAFRGPKWEIQEGGFLQLKYLAIEDSDLVQWKPAPGSFPELNYLSLKHCYKLKELCWPSNYGKIELVNCNPLAVTCANQIIPRCPYYLSIIPSDDY